MSLVKLNDDLPERGVKAFGGETGERAASKESTKSQALDAISKFIPTEMLAPYVAFLAYSAEQHTLSSESVYWWFVIATPLVAIFFQYARSAINNQPWPAIIAVAWRAIAATVAFSVWGLAPPGSAFQAGVGGPAVAGLAAVIVSPVLTGADAIVLKLMGIRRVAK
jgi:hypothetical protein